MKKAKQKFPEFIFVNIENEGEEEEFLMVNKDASDAVENDGPTVVATYRLVETKMLSKRLVSQDN